MTTKVFLDLEDTVITTWEDGVLINSQVVRDWLDQLGATELRIFSFAIWHAKDSMDFVTKGHKAALERVLGRPIVEWLSVEEMLEISRAHTQIQWMDRQDFMQLRGKHGAFFDVCKARESDCTCILLDDAVPHETLVVHHKNLELELHPIQLLTNQKWKNWA